MNTQIYNLTQVTDAVLAACTAALKNGALAVLPTETVYGIVAAAANEAAVKKLCAAKQKPQDVPLQYLAPSFTAAAALSQMSGDDIKLAKAFWPGELTLVLRPSQEGKKLLRGFDTLGLRVPAHEFTVKLLNAAGIILAASSANMHGKPVITSEEEIIKEFNGKVDYIFTGGAFGAKASSVVRANPLQILREGAITKAMILEALK